MEAPDQARSEANGPTIGSALTRVIGCLVAIPYAAVALLVLTGSPTWSAVAYLGGGALLVGSLIARRTSRRRWLGASGFGGLVCVILFRLVTGAGGSTLRFEPAPRLVDRLVEEQDIAIAGTRVLYASGLLKDDPAELPGAMRAAYAEMRTREGDLPSPLFATYLGMQSREAFDLVVIDPVNLPPGHPERDAVVFLHGYAGSFSLPCWQVAAAIEFRVLTACPATRWVGDWWSPEGESILRKTVERLHARGVTRIVLVGLSNGGYGASRLAPRMRGLFAGMILVSGAAYDAKPSGIPTLVIHGRHDTMARFGEATSYVARNGGELAALDAGHFAMLVRREESARHIRRFVDRVLGQTTFGR